MFCLRPSRTTHHCHCQLLVISILIGVIGANDSSIDPLIANPSSLTPRVELGYENPTETVNLTSYDDVSLASGMPSVPMPLLTMSAAPGEESGMPEFPDPDGNVTMVSWLDAEDNATDQVEEEFSAMTLTPEADGTATMVGNASATTMTGIPLEVNDTAEEDTWNDVSTPVSITEVRVPSYGVVSTTAALLVTEEFAAPATSTKRSRASDSNVSTAEVPSTVTSWRKTTPPQPESNEVPKFSWFILILDGNCTLAFSKGIMKESFKAKVLQSIAQWLKISADELTTGQNACPTDDKIHMNLTLYSQSKGSINISEQLNALEESAEPLLEVHGEPFYVFEIVTVDGFLSKEPKIPTDLRHSDVELLIYITVGSICAFLLALAIVLLMCKYCECRDQKPFDFGDAPNLNMRLEDYTLTRIPRPKLGYVDYYRGLTQRYCPLDDKLTTSPNGMVQPFDTSVVPLEDIQALDARSAAAGSSFRDCHDGVIVRPSNIQRFGRICHTTGRSVPSSASSYLDGDVDGYCIRSTENLHQWPKEDQYVDKGVDNPNFQ